MEKQVRSRVVAVVPDLFFQARIREAAGRTGVPLTVASTGEALRQALQEGGVGLVIVSLEAREPDPMEMIRIASASGGIRTLGFFSHVMEEVREKALAAGCQRVISKGAFTRDLPALLQEAAGGPES